MISCNDDRFAGLDRTALQILPAADGPAPAHDDEVSRIRKFNSDAVIHLFLGKLVHYNDSIAAAALIPIRFDQLSDDNECGFVEPQNNYVVRFYDCLDPLGHVGHSALNTVIDETDQHSQEEDADQGGQEHQKQEDPASRVARQYARIEGVIHCVP